MKKLRFLLFIPILALAACKPDIEACFSFSVNNSTGVVTFNSACSIDAVSFDWEFGDGETSISANPNHAYSTNGTYDVTLRVTDKKGRTATLTESVTVAACVGCANGSCVNGTCVCDAGYEGTNCDVPVNAKFSGIYTLQETCDSTGSDVYNVTLAPSSTNPAMFTFNGLYREPQALPASIQSDGVTFTIPLTNLGGYGTIQSSGTCVSNAEGTNINVIYQFTSTTNWASEQCTATLTRQ